MGEVVPVRKHSNTLTLLVAIWLGVAACGGDDDAEPDPAGGAADESEPAAAGDDTGDGSDDDGSEPAGNGDEAGESEATPGSESGVITIDGEPYEFAVEFCEGGEGALARIAGPGATPEGEPFWAEVRWGLGGPVTAVLGVGVVEPSATAEGDPQWSNRLDDGEQYVTFGDDGSVSISYQAPFALNDAPNEPEVPGSVDAACRLS